MGESGESVVVSSEGSESLIGSFQVESLNSLDLSSLLITPVQVRIVSHFFVRSFHLIPVGHQRLPRYKLLLEDFIRSTDLEHPDYPQLTEAIEKVSVNDILTSNNPIDLMCAG